MLKAELKQRCVELEEELHQAHNSIEYWQHEFNSLYEANQKKEREQKTLLGEFEEEISKISLTKSIELKEILTNFFK